MHCFNKRAALVIGCFILALVFVAPPFTQGDEWNLATKFTVNHQFEVPGVVLQANTPYVIRLHESPSTRNVVQIFNEDQTEMLTMFMGISSERMDPADETLFTFIETEPQYPLPIKEWFYPGRLRGLEFVYPKGQAMEIASHARGGILAADSSNLHDLNTIEVEAVGGVGETAPVAETAANLTEPEPAPVFEEEPAVVEESEQESPSELAAVEEEPYVDEEHVAEQENLEDFGQIAQNTESESSLKTEAEIQQEKPSEDPAFIEEEDTELPATAGELPLIALIGILCLGAGLGLKVLSAKS